MVGTTDRSMRPTLLSLRLKNSQGKRLRTPPTKGVDPVTKALQEVEEEHDVELVEKKDVKPNPIQFIYSGLISDTTNLEKCIFIDIGDKVLIWNIKTGKPLTSGFHRMLWIDLLKRDNLSPLNFRAIVTTVGESGRKLVSYYRPKDRVYVTQDFVPNLRFTYCSDSDKPVGNSVTEQFVLKHGPDIQRFLLRQK